MDAAEYSVTVGRAVSFCEGPRFDSGLGAFLSMFLQHEREQKCWLN